MNSTEEIWRPIRGFEGYEVSSLGRVRSCDRLVCCKCGSIRLYKGRILEPVKSKVGYMIVGLYKDGKRTNFTVHRLVAMAFPEICGQFRNELEVDHRNTVRTDNRAENLHWVTRSENSLNPITRQRQCDARKGDKCYMFGRLGKLHHRSKPIIQYSLTGEKIAEFEGLMDAGRKLGISAGCICMVLNGRYKHTHGFIFKYKQ